MKIRASVIALSASLLFAGSVIFFRLDHTDLTGDDAYYSIRSIGLTDVMFADVQETPMLWYERLPWWGYLSFHDHPLLLFLIQHAFLSIRASILMAKLPFALFALGTIALSYAWTNRLYGARAAAWTALLLAVNTDLLWSGRVPVLDSGVLFFLSLAIYAFTRFLDDKRWWWVFGIALGLLLETKLTAAFVLPAILTYVFFFRRDMLRKREWYGALGIAFLMALPFLIYNIGLFVDRGHFSLQLARLFPKNSPWKLAQAAVNPAAIFFLWKTMSAPYAIAAAAAFVWALARRQAFFLVIFLTWLTTQVLFTGLHPTLFVVFLAPLVSLAGMALWEAIPPNGWRKAYVLGIALGVVALGIFSARSLLLPHPTGVVGWTVSERTYNNQGFSAVDAAIARIVKDVDLLDSYWYLKDRQPSLAKFAHPRRPHPAEVQSLKRILLFDDSINWSGRVWAFERHIFYDNAAMFPASLAPLLNQLGVRPVAAYYVAASADVPRRRGADPFIGRFQEAIIFGHTPIEEIRRDDGTVAFQIYLIPGSDIPWTIQ